MVTFMMISEICRSPQYKNLKETHIPDLGSNTSVEIQYRAINIPLYVLLLLLLLCWFFYIIHMNLLLDLF